MKAKMIVLKKLKINKIDLNKIFRPERNDLLKIKKINLIQQLQFFLPGSTSVPKGVEISYYSFIYCAYETIKINYRHKQVFADYHDVHS